MFKYNPLHGLDFYKTGHMPQYPMGTETVYSNLTARSNKHFNWQQAGKGYVVLWGIQGFIQEFLVDGWNEGFFNLPKEQCIKAFNRRMKNSVGSIDTSHIEALHDLGYLPVKIKTLREGTAVPIGIPMFTIVNTLKEFFWLTNLLETVISAELWKPITTATIAYEYRKICEEFSSLTCDNNDHIMFQCHDFSMRGMSGWHDAARSSTGHLLSFGGTDTVCAIDYLEQYYMADVEKELVGASVPATEHSVMCMGGKEGEQLTVERLMTETYPTGIFSCVLDTWDFFKVLTEMLPALKDQIMSRDGKFVVRPDSGDPVDIICGTGGSRLENGMYRVFSGDPAYTKTTCKDVTEAESKGAVELLWDTFGGTVNSKGYKVLDEHIGLIYGDSITLERANEILKRLTEKGFAASNVVFGIGSYTYQMITRDTFGMAIKATWGMVNGEAVDIQKDPATDDGTKKSLCGRIMVYRDASTGELACKDMCSEREETMGELKPVFIDGRAVRQVSLEDCRKVLSEQ
jgi:nicotinamide phosphoribosyltransferase